MSFFHEMPPEGDSILPNMIDLTPRFHTEEGRNGALFSAKNRYNSTNLAVEYSLKEIFNQFHTMVTGNLKAIHLEEDDKPFL